MADQGELAERCRTCVERLSRSEGWDLDEGTCARYAQEIIRRVPAAALERQLEQIVVYYWRDHALAGALRDVDNPDHSSAWEWARHEIRRVIRVKRLHWSNDRSVEVEDLEQIAQIELFKAIADYRYESSLRTWLQSVIANRLLRFHRDSQAAKRTAELAPLEAAEQLPVAWDSFATDVNAAALLALIEATLRNASDDRLATVFRLRYVHERSAEEIGEMIVLHPSRIRALLLQARTILAQNPMLRSWFDDEHETSA